MLGLCPFDKWTGHIMKTRHCVLYFFQGTYMKHEKDVELLRLRKANEVQQLQLAICYWSVKWENSAKMYWGNNNSDIPFTLHTIYMSILFYKRQ